MPAIITPSTAYQRMRNEGLATVANRQYGESEARYFPQKQDYKVEYSTLAAMGLTGALNALADIEYQSRKQMLSKSAGFGFKAFDIYDRNITEAQRNAEFLLDLDAHHFEIDEDYLKLLGGIFGKIDKNEIRLPYDTCVFYLNYRRKNKITGYPPFVILKQHHYTKKITIYELKGKLVEVKSSKYLDDVLAVLVAMDTQIVGQSCVIQDLKLAPRKPDVWKRTFKVLRLKTAKKIIEGAHYVNTGRKAVAMHYRRGCWVHRGEKIFWRRATIVGNIENGVVDKVYKVGKN